MCGADVQEGVRRTLWRLHSAKFCGVGGSVLRHRYFDSESPAISFVLLLILVAVVRVCVYICGQEETTIGGGLGK
jgi:hypothetical protein